MTNLSLMALKALRKQEGFNESVRNAFKDQVKINKNLGSAIGYLGFGACCLGIGSLFMLKDLIALEASIESNRKVNRANYDDIRALELKVNRLEAKLEGTPDEARECKEECKERQEA